MGFRSVIRKSSSNCNQATSRTSVADIPKGCLAVYVGSESNEMKRFVIPVSFLNQPLFQELLNQAEEEFGFNHPMGGLTIPCREDAFIDLISRLNASS